MPDRWPIGVFASVDAGLGVPLEVAAELGAATVHLHAPHRAQRTPEHARRLVERLAELDLRVTAVFGGFAGESYADIPTVARSVGLVPPETRAERLAEMREIADFSRRLGVGVVALHLGFVPHDPAEPLYRDVVAVTRELCDYCRDHSQSLHLETGQEPADTLLAFLGDVSRENLKVNFDPANMILYGAGEPIAALKQLGRNVASVHCKDARWAVRPGEEWGVETPLGEGEVGFERFLETLASIGYFGSLTIEREIPHEPDRQRAEIGRAIELLTRIKSSLRAA